MNTNTETRNNEVARKPRAPRATVEPVATGKKMSQRDMSAITKELNEALDKIGKRHHVALGAYAAQLSKRGKLNIIVKGEAGEESVVKKTKMLDRRRDDETLPQFRLRVHCKQVGLTTDILGKVYKIGGKEYEVLGLRGKAHKVLMQNKKTGEPFEMLPSVFLDQFESANA